MKINADDGSCFSKFCRMVKYFVKMKESLNKEK